MIEDGNPVWGCQARKIIGNARSSSQRERVGMRARSGARTRWQTPSALLGGRLDRAARYVACAACRTTVQGVVHGSQDLIDRDLPVVVRVAGFAGGDIRVAQGDVVHGQDLVDGDLPFT